MYIKSLLSLYDVFQCSRDCGGGSKFRKVRCQQLLALGTLADRPEGSCPRGPRYGERERERERAQNALKKRTFSFLDLRKRSRAILTLATATTTKRSSERYKEK